MSESEEVEIRGELLTSAHAKELGLLEQERKLHENRIKRYSLGEFVWEMHLQGYSNYKIANLCNEELKERINKGDPKQYIMINATNIDQYLRSSKMEIEKAPTDTTSKNNMAIVQAQEKVTQQLGRSLTILEAELEKLRNPNPNVPVLETRQEFFLKLMQEIRSFLELSAKIQGQLQPAVSINLFSQNINRLCDKISAETQLTNAAKAVILNMIAETVITPDLANPEVIDVEAREISNAEK